MICCRGAILTLLACLLIGCGGGGTASTGNSGGGNQTPDMGTLTPLDDSYQYTLTNKSTGMVLGISAQAQIAGADVIQEPASTTTADIDWHFIPMSNNQYNIENMLTH
jgi:hypothetical protein